MYVLVLDSHGAEPVAAAANEEAADEEAANKKVGDGATSGEKVALKRGIL
jgi:hypothetical protein